MIEVAHWAALVPLAWLLVFERDAGGRRWLIALAFAASWFADAWAAAFGGSWAMSYVLPPVQFGLFAAAYGVGWLFFLFAVLAGFEVLVMPPDTPALWCVLISAGLVTRASWGRTGSREVVTYCGAGTVCYVPLALGVSWFWPAWVAYQGVRLSAFAVFCWNRGSE